jgi:hypothetical protein
MACGPCLPHPFTVTPHSTRGPTQPSLHPGPHPPHPPHLTQGLQALQLLPLWVLSGNQGRCSAALQQQAPCRGRKRGGWGPGQVGVRARVRRGSWATAANVCMLSQTLHVVFKPDADAAERPSSSATEREGDTGSQGATAGKHLSTTCCHWLLKATTLCSCCLLPGCPQPTAALEPSSDDVGGYEEEHEVHDGADMPSPRTAPTARPKRGAASLGGTSLGAPASARAGTTPPKAAARGPSPDPAGPSPDIDVGCAHDRAPCYDDVSSSSRGPSTPLDVEEMDDWEGTAAILASMRTGALAAHSPDAGPAPSRLSDLLSAAAAVDAGAPDAEGLGDAADATPPPEIAQPGALLPLPLPLPLPLQGPDSPASGGRAASARVHTWRAVTGGTASCPRAGPAPSAARPPALAHALARARGVQPRTRPAPLPRGRARGAAQPPQPRPLPPTARAVPAPCEVGRAQPTGPYSSPDPAGATATAAPVSSGQPAPGPTRSSSPVWQWSSAAATAVQGLQSWAATGPGPHPAAPPMTQGAPALPLVWHLQWPSGITQAATRGVHIPLPLPRTEGPARPSATVTAVGPPLAIPLWPGQHHRATARATGPQDHTQGPDQGAAWQSAPLWLPCAAADVPSLGAQAPGPPQVSAAPPYRVQAGQPEGSLSTRGARAGAHKRPLCVVSGPAAAPTTAATGSTADAAGCAPGAPTQPANHAVGPWRQGVGAPLVGVGSAHSKPHAPLTLARRPSKRQALGTVAGGR